ncbi:ASTE1-like protein, partial [Mya arenaria]
MMTRDKPDRPNPYPVKPTMGVSGLFKVIDDSKLLTDYDLHDTRLIIDGSNLYHFLYNLPEEYGGNYDTYADTCKTFFATLKACKVEPYVVLDGGYDPDNQKWNTVVQRKESRIYNASKICKKGPDPIKPTVDMDDGNDPEWNTVLNRKTYKRARDVLKRENGTEVTKDHVWPILCEETFCHVLRELQIPHVKCPYEADREIAVLANMWKCPIEDMDEPSTYNCSRNIRKVLYGLTGKSKIEENDRQKIKIITVDITASTKLQTCYLSAVYLNQALMYPVDLPSPAVLFNCTLMYNVCRSLKTSKITDCSDNVCKSLETSKITNCSDNRFMRLETSEINDFADNICNSLETSENTDCSDIFPLKSPLHNLFTLWKTVVKTTESKDGVA